MLYKALIHTHRRLYHSSPINFKNGFLQILTLVPVTVTGNPKACGLVCASILILFGSVFRTSEISLAVRNNESLFFISSSVTVTHRPSAPDRLWYTPAHSLLKGFVRTVEQSSRFPTVLPRPAVPRQDLQAAFE